MAYGRRTEADSVAAVVVVAVLVASWLADQPMWLQILSTVSFVVMVLGLWALFRLPTSCGVANRTRPYPCHNPVKGMLAACHLPAHKAQKRKLILARLRGRRVATAPRPAAPRFPDRAAPAPAAAAGASTGEYWVPGAAYHRAMLVATLVSAVCAAPGALSTVIAMLDR